MLDRKTFFVRERVGLLKLSDTYDIMDPETGAQIGIAKEKPGALAHVARLIVNRQLLPTKVFVYEGDDPEDESKLLFSIRRGFSFFRYRIVIADRDGKTMGRMVNKVFSLGGAFRVFDASGSEAALVQGDWKGWNFKVLDMSGNEIGTITKKWAGLARELLTSADNYVVSLKDDSPKELAILLLAAGLAIDIVYKEKG